MRTPNTLHKMHCSIGGCLNDALVTMPCPGNEVRGYCGDHISELHKTGFMQALTDSQWSAIMAALQRKTTTERKIALKVAKKIVEALDGMEV